MRCRQRHQHEVHQHGEEVEAGAAEVLNRAEVRVAKSELIYV